MKSKEISVSRRIITLTKEISHLKKVALPDLDKALSEAGYLSISACEENTFKATEFQRRWKEGTKMNKGACRR